jgi:hypothetical protein
MSVDSNVVRRFHHPARWFHPPDLLAQANLLGHVLHEQYDDLRLAPEDWDTL